MNGYKFFLFGCLFTSLTWSLSLYMYWKLNTRPDNYSNVKLFRKENTYEYVKKQKSKYFKNHMDKNDLSDLGIIKTDDDLTIRDKGYKDHGFNALVSLRLGNYRETLPDTRHKLCSSIKYDQNLEIRNYKLHTHLTGKNNNINKRLRGALDNHLTFKLYNRSIHSNIKTNSILLKLANKNLQYHTCIRRRQHIRVQIPR